MLVGELGYGFYRHGFSQCHDHGFKQQRKAAVGSGPWNINQVSTTLVALGPWHSGGQVSFMFEKVQMSPRFLYSVVRF